MNEFPPRFDFKSVEDKWIKFWEENQCFHSRVNPAKKPYSIVIPPPNVTGILHMGHALNNTLQDIMIRYKRMRGYEVLWMPGTDHAGIATQNVVEKDLAKEGKKRHDVGREVFLERLWEWKNKYGDTIIHQLKKLGSSCDWPRARFTMDEAYSEAVKFVFVDLYKKGLIYRGEYIINWCPRCQTALSDEEAEHKETQGNLYHIRYPFKDSPNEFLTVATTRPETMLGDTAVAVNPQDKRYKKFIGKTLILPLMEREIPVIADELVDLEFGTGAVKVTPAHDPNDFEMGRRHNLPFINVMHPDGRINENGGSFNSLDRFEARVKVIESLKDREFLSKVEQHTHAVGHCYRCQTVVEPYLSKQWFVKMKPLAKPAAKVVKDGKVKFYPERWTKVYLNWMENIRDWCISRQIWWGHRIPVWYCVGDEKCQLSCKEPIVSIKTPEKCPHCGSKNLRQDEDVLDTWFSSWLWPFATLGWPVTENRRQLRRSLNNSLEVGVPTETSGKTEQIKKDLEYFYPTASLFTAPEIIFFWVARMIMGGLEFMGEIPFKDIYIHGTVRDAKGRKMSKSLGNAIDPLEIINEYGADALRFSLIINSGQDIFISKDKFEIGRNFANKIWNATRFILMSYSSSESRQGLDKSRSQDIVLDGLEQYQNLDLSSRWIISKFYETLEKVNQAIENFRFSEAETLIYDFFWGNFCDWYLEIIKDKLADKTIQNTAFKILELSLKMIHPFMPFVTEEIWSQLPASPAGLSAGGPASPAGGPERKGSLCVDSWPRTNEKCIDTEAVADMNKLIGVVTCARNIRAQWNIKPQDKISCYLISKREGTLALLNSNKGLIQGLAGIHEIFIDKDFTLSKNMAAGLVEDVKVLISLEGIIDIEKEKRRILNQMEEHKKAVLSLSQRLKNRDFIRKAPEEVILKEKERLGLLENKIKELEHVLVNFQ